jgi:hypothetical protein
VKECRLCRRLLPLDEFHRATGARDGHRGECKDCFRAKARERYPQVREQAIERARRWREENIDRFRENQRRRRSDPAVKAKERNDHLRRKFGLSQDDYERMLARQDSGCAICKRPPSPTASLHVDHDHETGRVRALLCVSCNNALGSFQEDPEIVRRARSYLLLHDPGTQDDIERARQRARELLTASPN